MKDGQERSQPVPEAAPGPDQRPPELEFAALLRPSGYAVARVGAAAGSAVDRRSAHLAGIGLSRGRAGGREHYALSGAAGQEEAAELAAAVRWLCHPHRSGELVAGPAGVYHLLVG